MRCGLNRYGVLRVMRLIRSAWRAVDEGLKVVALAAVGYPGSGIAAVLLGVAAGGGVLRRAVGAAHGGVFRA